MGMSTPDEILATRARARCGAFTRKQALEAGFTQRQVESRLTRRAWRPLHPGVYCASTTPLTRATVAVAARLHVGEVSRYSHVTAAHL